MRWVMLLATTTTVYVNGCPKKVEVEDPTGTASQAAASGDTALLCPEGGELFGSPPPKGREEWCGVTLPTGAIQRSGAAREYTSEGRLKAAGVYAANQRTGHWWFFDDDGAVEREGDYTSGAESGYWFHYDDQGVSAEGAMKNGGRHGIWVSYDEERRPSQGTWVDGERDGVWVEFDEDNNPTRERVYRRGRLISQREL